MIRLPQGIQRAFPLTVLLRLPGAGAAAARRFQHCSVSGFPLPCLRSCIPYAVACAVQEPLGPPKFFDASLPACHGLRTPADLHHLAIPVVRVLPSGAFKPSASATPFRSCTSTSGCAVTPAAYRILCLRFAHLVRRVYHRDSAMDARLDTGGGLALTRQGLAPCKRRQAFLGARTPGLRRRRKPERSGGWRRSPAGRC